MQSDPKTLVEAFTATRIYETSFAQQQSPQATTAHLNASNVQAEPPTWEMFAQLAALNPTLFISVHGVHPPTSRCFHREWLKLIVLSVLQKVAVLSASSPNMWPKNALGPLLPSSPSWIGLAVRLLQLFVLI
jgi:hypothetical protein